VRCDGDVHVARGYQKSHCTRSSTSIEFGGQVRGRARRVEVVMSHKTKRIENENESLCMCEAEPESLMR